MRTYCLVWLCTAAVVLPANSATHSSAETDIQPTILAPAHEPGERLGIEGRVLDYRGEPLERAAVVAYQAAADGLYNPPRSPSRTPRLRAVAVTDTHGGFRLLTVRPGTYPDRSEPAHVHLEVNAPAHQLRYVTIWFDDDPLVDAGARARARRDREIVIVTPNKTAGVWKVNQTIQLKGN